MSGERYVVLGLAPVRAGWFRDVARWANAGVVPIEFVKTVSVEELRARLGSGRGFSALLLGDDVPGADRDLLEAAREAGCAVVVVSGGRAARDWLSLGASAVLAARFDRAELVDVLARVSAPLEPADRIHRHEAPAPGGGACGRLVAVTGAGGTGSSTLAIALAQGLAAEPRQPGLVCLADLALRADQGMLHDVGDVVPGVLELVDAHRSGSPTTATIRELTWHVAERGYHLLLGLRRAREWTSIRPRAFAAALDGLRRSFRVVVADVDADVEGEDATGSADVEDRNVMARTATLAADVVVVVGRPGMKGLHSLVRVVGDLTAHGVDAAKLVPVVNGAPRAPARRAELTAAFGALTAQAAPAAPTPVLLPLRRRLEEALREGTRLPPALTAPVTGVVRRLLGRAPASEPIALRRAPVPVAPGSLGSWTEEDAT